MNHTYRLVWNQETQRYVPAPECARGKGKSSAKSTSKALAPAAVLLGAALSLPALAQAPPANALPTGGQVAAGQADISQSGNQMMVNQGTNKAIIDWSSFNIGSNAGVTFQQPNANAIALNRVSAGDASQIHGQLNANGQVWLINPNGIVFGQGSKVDVGGLVASTMNIANEDFLNGKHTFSRNGATGSITNQGELTAKDGGYVALLAPTVSNDGILRAQLGTVAMAAGDKITLQAGANGLLNVGIDPATIRTLVENKQLIVADGGQVIMTGKAADQLSSSVVSNTGIIQANRLQEKDGKILLIADMQHGETKAAGTLEAHFIDTSAAIVHIDKDLKINTAGGEWLIDPVDITIDASKAQAIETALGTGNVTVSTSNGHTNPGESDANNGSDAGDIHVNADITYTQNKLTLNADNNINLNAEINVNGSGTLALNYGGTAGNSSATPATGSSINASFGANGGFAGKVNFAKSGAGLLDINGRGYTVIKDAAALQDMNSGLTGQYVLGGDIDASGVTNFEPIGNGSTYSGIFDGLGHTIKDLKINWSGKDYAGLFGATNAATLRNVGLEGGSTTGKSFTGGLVGYSKSSSISHSYTTGSTTGMGTDDDRYTGGLVGYSESSSISHSYATGNTTGMGTDSGHYTGGLVGYSYSGSISQSYATGNTTGENYTGGLVGGTDFSSISDSYATGSTKGGIFTGGLVGYNNGGSISQSYATGSTTGSEAGTGGLVGYSTGSISNAFYATTDAEGNAINSSSNALGTAKTWLEMAAPSLYASWTDFNTHWEQRGGGATVAGYEVALPSLKNLTRVEDVQRTTLFDGGWGTAASAYGISTWQNLANIGHSNAVLDGDYHFALTQDLGSGTVGYAALAGSSANGGLGWKPLGNDDNPFKGTFDGQGHTISDLKINRSTQDSVGLFGETLEATVQGVGMVDAHVVGHDYVGSLVGFNGNRSTVSHSYATGSVDGRGDGIGGLVGVNAFDSSISRSYAASNVQATDGFWVGGLVGTNLDNSTIRHSYATGAVAGGRAWFVGGLVGENDSSTIEQSYATGKVEGGTNLGGLVGLVSNNFGSSSIDSSYYATTDAAGRSINNGGNTQGKWASNKKGTAKTWDELMNPGLYTGWDTNTWQLGGRGAAVEGYEAGGLPFLKNVTRAQDVVGSGTTLFDGGWGTAASAYGISTWQNLANIGYNNAVLGGNYHFALTQDLGSGSAGYAALAGSSANGGLGWKPLGADLNNRFKGTFDGQGHTISDLTINRPGQNFVGLFGATNAATLRNVGLAGGSITGGNRTGGLVGYMYGGSISQSYATGSTTGGNNTGGLVGYMYGGSISQSYATGSTTGGNNTGGLVGYSEGSSIISQSYATGNTAGGDFTGGLVGYNIGGMISHSYATGNTSGGSYTGGLVGYSTGSIDNAYYATTDADGNTINQDDGYNTLGTAKTYADLQQLQTFADAGWDISAQGGESTVWRIYEGQTGPLLRGFLKQVTVTADVDSITGKTYDGSAASGTASYTTDVTGAVLDGSLGYATNSKNAGSYSTTAGNLSITQGLYSGQQGYDISYVDVDAELTIEKKALTISGITADSKTYDGNTDATVHVGTAVLGGLIGGDDLSVTASGTFDTKNAGTGKTVTLSSSYSGADLDNYAITDQTTTTADIAKKALTVSGITADSKTYDGTTVATVRTGGAQFDGLVAGDDLSVAASGTFDNKNAGTGKTVALTSSYGGADVDNYAITGQASTTADIAKRALTVSGITADSKTYDGNTDATVHVGTAVLGGLIDGDKLTVAATGQFDNKNAGTGKTVTLTSSYDGADLNNYEITSQTETTADIAKKALIVSGITADSKTYDGNTDATVNTGAAVLGGLVNGDMLTVAATGQFDNKNAGNGKTVTLTSSYGGDDVNNYEITSQTETTADIGKKALTVSGITADSKTYDGTTAATVRTGGAQFDGLVAGDDLSVAASGTFDNKNAGTGKTVALTSSYGGADVDNYAITGQASTTADIAKRALTVSGITADSKTYDGNTDATVNTGAAVLDGLVNGDMLTVAVMGQFDNKNAGNGKTVTLTSSYDGADLNNYEITSQTETTADIAKKALIVSGITADSKTYDGNTDATVNTGAAVLGGLVNGDMLTVAATGQFDNKNAGTSKTVTLTSSYDGADVDNYTITGQTETTADIAKKALTVSGITADSKTYDGNTDAIVHVGTAVLGGLIDGDKLTVAATGQFDNKNAGTSKTVALSSSYSGADLDNYAITDQTTTTADIAKKALTVSGITADSKTYDGNTDATVNTGAAVLGGLVNGDMLTVAVMGQFDNKNAGNGKTVTLTSSYGGDDVNNYEITSQTETTADIAKKALTVSGITADSKTYDGTTAATVRTGGAQFDGLVEGDDLTVFASGVFGDKNAGRGKTVALTSSYGGDDVGNYEITGQATATADIDRKALVITATDAEKTQGDALALDGSTGFTHDDGLVAGETVDRVLLASAGTDAGAEAGAYGITARDATGSHGFDADNYAITYEKGTLTVATKQGGGDPGNGGDSGNGGSPNNGNDGSSGNNAVDRRMPLGGAIWLVQNQQDDERLRRQRALSGNLLAAADGVPYLTLAPGFIRVPGEESAEK